MADEVKIKIVVTGVDQAKRDLSSLKTTTNSTLNNISGNLKTTGQAFSSAGRKIFGTTALIGGGFLALANKAGKFQSVQDSFNSMSKGMGIDGKKLIANMKEATSGTVTEMEVMSNFMMSSTLIGKEALGDQGKNFERMAIIAKKAARATGQDVNFLMESIVKGVGRGSKVLLDNTGVVINVAKVTQDYADKLGIAKDEMAETQKKTAVMTAFLGKAEDVYKDVAVTAGGASSSFARMRVTLDEVATTIGMELIPAIQPLLDDAVPIIKMLAEKFKELPAPVKKFAVLAVVLGAGLGLLMMVIGPILTGLGTLVGLIGAIASPVGIVVAAIVILVVILKKLADRFGITEVVLEKVGLVFQFLKNTWEELRGAFESERVQNAITRLKETFNRLLDAMRPIFDMAKKLLEKVFGPMEGAVDKSAGAFGGLENAIVQVEGFINGMAMAVESMIPILNWLVEALRKSWHAFSALVNMGRQVQWFFQNLPAVIKFLVAVIHNSIIGFFNSLPGRIRGLLVRAKNVVIGFKNQFKAAGANLIQGVINGIRNKVGSAIAEVRNLGSSLIGSFQNILGEHSPSKVFMESGKNMVRGLNIGVDKEGLEDNALLGVDSVLPNQNAPTAGGATLTDIRNILLQILNASNASVNFNGDVALGGERGIEQQKQSLTNLLLEGA